MRQHCELVVPHAVMLKIKQWVATAADFGLERKTCPCWFFETQGHGQITADGTLSTSSINIRAQLNT